MSEIINFDSEICTDFARASSREWLETNGVGGFASSTISGAHTRRYHALLVAATRPPLGRVVLLSKFEEAVILDGVRYELSVNQYEGAVYPQGYKYLKNFRLAPFPVWTFEIEGVSIEKKVFMIDCENATVARFKVQSSKFKVELELKPLVAFRDYHGLRRADENFDGEFSIAENQISIQPEASMPALFFAHDARAVEKTGVWYRNFEYAIERERGFDFTEDLFQPFALKFDLNEAATVIASTSAARKIQDAQTYEAKEIERRAQVIKISGAENDFTKQLALAADQFIAARGAGKTVIAGYPWFSDWGRDTMIALNGLTLATNREEIARDILLEFSNHISEGMLPNRFPDVGETPEYNTVDATLWYFEAARAYAAKTNDYKFVRLNLYEKLVDIIVWHVRGTRYKIKVDDADGLLYAGESGVQLTWMDAKIGDYVVTPRTGKAVEIQALWYNALCAMADFAGTFGDWADEKKYLELARKAKGNFSRTFWNEREECLFDVVNGEEKDASVRPNQIFAVSLAHQILDGDKALKVVRKVETELLTAYGLRSLSPSDARYCPIYIGSPFQRDSAYHQGTVWAWLTGAFVDAYRKVYASNAEKRVNEILENFKTHLLDAGVGQISEIFDADAPFNPRGCFAQAWSVAEILRVCQNRLR